MLYRSFFVAIWLIAGVAVQAALPVAIPAADGDTNYDVDVLGVRAQVDF